TLWGIWWYVVIHPMADVESIKPAAVTFEKQAMPAPQADKSEPQEEKSQELGAGMPGAEAPGTSKEPESLQEMGNPELLKEGASSPSEAGPPAEFYRYFWIIVVATALLLSWYYRKMEG